MQNKKYFSLLIVSLIAISFLIVAPAFAQGGPGFAKGMGKGEGRPAVFGIVSLVNGTTITVTSKAKPNGGATTTYTVDASNATVTKNGASSSVSNIAVGDNVRVQGTVTGTNVVAKNIIDGVGQLEIQGNGQPVVAGNITAINGNTITITNKSNVTYTVDATNAKILVGNQVSSISSLANGDNAVVQGTINGTSVVASTIIDQKPKANTTTGNSENKKPNLGFFGGIGNFFKNLFGF